MQVCRRTIHCRTLRLDFDGFTTDKKLSHELQATKLACSTSQRAVELHSRSLSSAWAAGNDTFDGNDTFENLKGSNACLGCIGLRSICLARGRSAVGVYKLLTSGRGVSTKVVGFRAISGSEFRLLKSSSLGTASEALVSSRLISTQ